MPWVKERGSEGEGRVKPQRKSKNILAGRHARKGTPWKENARSQKWQTPEQLRVPANAAPLIKLACLSLGLAGLAAGVAWGWLGNGRPVLVPGGNPQNLPGPARRAAAAHRGPGPPAADPAWSSPATAFRISRRPAWRCRADCRLRGQRGLSDRGLPICRSCSWGARSRRLGGPDGGALMGRSPARASNGARSRAFCVRGGGFFEFGAGLVDAVEAG